MHVQETPPICVWGKIANILLPESLQSNQKSITGKILAAMLNTSPNSLKRLYYCRAIFHDLIITDENFTPSLNNDTNFLEGQF